MVLERLFPSDFACPAAAPDRGSAARWPISYEDLRPWYEAAERLYRVRGGDDPLRPGEAAGLLPPPPFSAEGASLVDTLLTQGVHPYRVHTACEERRGCLSCQGHLCGADCKNDAARICLIPAVNDHGATLMTECAAMAVEADRTTVHRLVCVWRGQHVVVRSKIFVVAAGALLTPALLLNSRSVRWPNGVANDSGLVGRNLMRHAIDLSVLTKAPRLRADRLTKEIAFNDFYANGSEKLGSVQSFGVAMPLGYLRNRPGVNLWRLLGPLAPWFWKQLRATADLRRHPGGLALSRQSHRIARRDHRQQTLPLVRALSTECRRSRAATAVSFRRGPRARPIQAHPCMGHERPSCFRTCLRNLPVRDRSGVERTRLLESRPRLVEPVRRGRLVLPDERRDQPGTDDCGECPARGLSSAVDDVAAINAFEYRRSHHTGQPCRRAIRARAGGHGTFALREPAVDAPRDALRRGRRHRRGDETAAARVVGSRSVDGRVRAAAIRT